MRIRLRNLSRSGALSIGRTPGRKRPVLGLIVVFAALVLPAVAGAAVFGQRSLQYFNCCNNQTLDGTRAYTNVSSISPDSNNCIAFASAVTAILDSGQLQVALLRCGTNANIGGTCSLSNNFVKVVERIPHSGGSAVCYPHGAAATNTNYRLTVDEDANDGVWWTYIDGTLYEGQSGYTNDVKISEWGEHTGSGTCAWTASASFTGWQRYNYPNNVWTTVQSSNVRNDGCWTVGALNSGNFTVSR